MRLGIVGGGYWGSKHLRVFATNGDIEQVTLIESDDRRRNELRKAFPSVQGASRLENALDDLDAVVVATPPSTHLSLGLQAIRAGKHVLIEKPMATSVDDAHLLVGAAEEHGVVLMAGHTFEFNPVVVELKRRITQGELGNILYLRSLRLSLGLYQSDVNVIWDLAPHDLSIINFLLDDEPSTVTAWGHRSLTNGNEDLAMIRLQYERSDVEAFVHVSWLDPSKVRETTVVGSEKMAVYDDVKSEERLRIFDRGVSHSDADLHSAPMSYRYGDITSPYIDFVEPLALEDGYFLEAIRDGRATRASGQSGCRVVEALAAADESLRRGEPVRIAREENVLIGAVPDSTSVAGLRP